MYGIKMSTTTSNIKSESICATCLSQNRKLIAIRDSRACDLSYFQLSLYLSDRICWECHNFMRRMVAFKNRVQRAQAWLWKMANEQQYELHSLSTLTTSKGSSLDIIPPDLTGTDPQPSLDIKPEPTEVTIKEEVTKEVPLMECTAYPNQVLCQNMPEPSTSYQQNNHVRTPVSMWPQIIITPLMKLTELADGIDGNCDVGDLADVAQVRTNNIVEMRVFSHNKAPKATVLNTSDKTTVIPQSEVRPDFIFTETILSEEEMMQWRQDKAKSEYYLRSVPTERCEQCLEVFDHKRRAQAHAVKHSENYGDLVCEICQQRAVDREVMAVHRKSHYRLLKCRYCPFIWDNVNSMRHHCSEMHKIQQDLWECDQCERQFSSLKLLRRHERSHRHVRCPDCEQLFVAGSLKHHMLQHVGGLPLKTCSVCGGRYRGEMGLRTHLLRHHTHTEADETAYCGDCKLFFRNQTVYRTHLKSSKHVTKEEFRFECNECGKKFLNIHEIRNHMDVHSDTQYPCQQCERVFNTRRTRRDHVRRVHEGKARREHICDYCGKILTTTTQLAQHINSHTGARPFACNICGATFGYRSALYLHGRFKHKIQKRNKDTKKRNKPE